MNHKPNEFVIYTNLNGNLCWVQAAQTEMDACNWIRRGAAWDVDGLVYVIVRLSDGAIMGQYRVTMKPTIVRIGSGEDA